MANIVLSSLRGGLNTTDPPLAIRDDQCTEATNVSFYLHPCGGRRYGSTEVDLTGAGIAAQQRVTWLFRHLPGSNDADAQLWALGHSSSAGGSLVLSYKDSSWHDVTIPDTAAVTSAAIYRWSGASLHGKLAILYDSSVDRAHMWDGSSLRRMGLAPPAAAPTAADTGAAGTLDGNRHYRVRETVQSGGSTILRSEPSAVLTHNPPGTKAEITVMKPATANSNATHWELEASLVLNGDYYVLATTDIGTSTVVDTTTEAAGYAGGTLSETIGAYTVPHSARIVLVDDDRYLFLGSWEDASMDASVSWTPVENDPGVGNDERIPLDPVSTVNLDGKDGGKITAGGSAVTGEIWVFKHTRTYKLVRTYNPDRAYDVVMVSGSIGALEGSVTSGIDETGQPALYFTDPSLGPCRIVAGVIEHCGRDVLGTWRLFDPSATIGVSCRALYYPDEQQVMVFAALAEEFLEIAVQPGDALVLQTTAVRRDVGGVTHGGWAKWDGDFTDALTCCLFAHNINANTDRALRLVPCVGGSTALFVGSPRILMLDPDALDDDGNAFEATLTPKAFLPAGIQRQCELQSVALVADAVENAGLVVSAIPNFTPSAAKTADEVSFTPGAGGSYEASDTTDVIRWIDDIGLAECVAVQVSLTDVETVSAAWGLSRISLRLTSGQESP